jgi:hypothetical protein
MREIDRLIDCMSVYTHRASFDIERHYIVHCFQCTQLQPVWLELSTTSSRSIIIATTDVQCRHQPSILRLESAADSRLPMYQSTTSAFAPPATMHHSVQHAPMPMHPGPSAYATHSTMATTMSSSSLASPSPATSASSSAYSSELIVSENDIRDTFYESMVDQATSGEGFLFTRPMLQFPNPGVKLLLACCALIEMLAASQGITGGLRLLRGKILRPDTCPAAFNDFTGGLMQLKEPIEKMNNRKRTQLKVECASQIGVGRAGIRLQHPILVNSFIRIAGMLSQREIFIRVIDNVIAYALQVLSPNDDAPPSYQQQQQQQQQPPPPQQQQQQQQQQQHQQYHHQARPSASAPAIPSAPSPSATDSFSGVSETTLRETFYAAMFTQATTNGLFNAEALADHEPFIFIALSAHALIELIANSRHVPRGIVLANGSVMTEVNCPPPFRPMLQGMLMLKSAFDSLSQEQLLVIKFTSVELPMPAHLQAWRTPQLMELAGRINSVASQISQRAEFHSLISQVIDLSVDCLQQQ